MMLKMTRFTISKMMVKMLKIRINCNKIIMKRAKIKRMTKQTFKVSKMVITTKMNSKSRILNNNRTHRPSAKFHFSSNLEELA